MLIIAHKPNKKFLENPLVQNAQNMEQFKALRELFDEVFDSAQVQLALTNDLAPANELGRKAGRPCTPLQVTGRLAILRRLMDWSYRMLEDEVNQSAGWRWVCDLYEERMPRYSTIQGREARLQSGSMDLIHRTVAELARRRKLTEGKLLRLDASVTETNIHYPTDSSLLDDSARVLSRLIKRARAIVKPKSSRKQQYRSRALQSHRLAVRISRLAAKHRKSGQSGGKTGTLRYYTQLLTVLEQLLAQVAQAQKDLRGKASVEALALESAFKHYVPLVERVVAQARQRVLEGLTVPASEKLVSLFEPHSAIIVRGKSKPHETEFGVKVWLAEVDGGIISEYRLLQGNPSDTQQVIPSLEHHRAVFGRVPQQICGDRGTYSEENESAAHAMKVKRVSLPKPGHKTPRRTRYEKQEWFRAAQRFRNGIEGRISQVRRARGLRRCLNHGPHGIERWIAWGVIANNIAVMVNALTAKKKRRAKRAVRRSS